MKNILSIALGGILLVSIVLFFASTGENPQTANPITNITIVGGKQIISISAKGGYSPKVTEAKADMGSVIKVTTQGTFDCSSALIIPSLAYRKNLPPSGETEIELPAQKVGTSIRGLCAMGMYNFVVNFN